MPYNKKMKERIAHLLEEAKAQEHVPAEFVAAANFPSRFSIIHKDPETPIRK